MKHRLHIIQRLSLIIQTMRWREFMPMRVISGTNTKKREDFNRMIEDCNTGKIDMIITKSISRFARNTLDCLNYVRMLKELGVEVIFEKENIRTMDSKGEVLLTILSSLAHVECVVFIERK